MEKARLFFIDNLRILLIALVAMMHLSITYGGVGSWYYRNVPEGYMSIPLTWHNGTVQAVPITPVSSETESEELQRLREESRSRLMEDNMMLRDVLMRMLTRTM